ncbi:C6 zinc finger domain protein [Dactylonectria macrodidyma]|uniref:C6 zinc finger domain protein n=1 Tax=Dactylonectria macrodidyma TaxID=307937 RepID=A0A9P9FHB5_9HYPO|nr:C6 zinc finger domain protein [Dactylonectria macrodidyma]
MPCEKSTAELGCIRRPRRTKARSGCRTCKIRKVKCDEGRPACHRCVSTGRTCEGYGIWGGGNSTRPQGCVQAPNSPPITRLPAPISLRVLDASERDCFEWFTLISAKKLRGIFSSTFWDTLVFQASVHEPAVLHAVLALGSVQRQEVMQIRDIGCFFSAPDDEEQFVLRQYSKAISYLVPDPHGESQPSVDAVLLTCLVFIFLEFLRGRYKAAQAHLQNGLKLIEEAGSNTEMTRKGHAVMKSPSQCVNKGILEAFSRVQVQVGLLGHFSQASVNPHLGPETTIDTFESVEQARESLDRLLNEALQLTEACHRDRVEQSGCCNPGLALHQRKLRVRLETWDSAYSLSTATISTTMPFVDRFSYRLLRSYYTMAVIMVESTTDSSSEMVFDEYTNEFASIVSQAQGLQQVVLSNPVLDDLPPRHPNKHQSIADMGWIPPLYYTALKCRVRRLRLQAIDLLRSLPHREGIWDANIAACIAEKMMAIEEGRSSSPVKQQEFCHQENSGPHDDILLTIPESNRIHNVSIELPDNPRGDLSLTYRKRRDDGTWEDFRTNWQLSAVP